MAIISIKDQYDENTLHVVQSNDLLPLVNNFGTEVYGVTVEQLTKIERDRAVTAESDIVAYVDAGLATKINSSEIGVTVAGLTASFTLDLSTTSVVPAVLGASTAGTGTASVGVKGTASNWGNYGVFGETTNSTGASYGVYGKIVCSAGNAAAVKGDSNGTVGASYGVQGTTQSATLDAAGVHGHASNGSGSAHGIYGTTVCPTGFGGKFVNTNGADTTVELSGATDLLIGYLDAVEKFRVTDAGALSCVVATFPAEVANTGTTQTVDWNDGQKQNTTITAATGMTFTAPAGPCDVTLKIINGGTGVITWPAAVLWPGGTEPIWTVAGTDIVSFYFDGTNYYGTANLAFA